MNPRLKFIFFVLIINFPNWSKAGDFEAPETRDSLIDIVNDHTKHDTVIASNCFYLGHWYLYEQPDSAEYYANIGLERSEAANHIQGMVTGYGFFLLSKQD